MERMQLRALNVAMRSQSGSQRREARGTPAWRNGLSSPACFDRDYIHLVIAEVMWIGRRQARRRGHPRNLLLHDLWTAAGCTRVFRVDGGKGMRIVSAA